MKIDFKKELKGLFAPSSKPSLVEVPAMAFLMIDGVGDPKGNPAYQAAVETLYAMAYGLKFISKKNLGQDYVVPPLEGLWWTDRPEDAANRQAWHWTAMIMQPPWVDETLVAQARESVQKKKNPPALDKLRFDHLCEGLSAQILHKGPYAEEEPTIECLHRFIKDQGYLQHGKHHEIYLNDPRRTAPEKLKTIIRQPITLANS